MTYRKDSDIWYPYSRMEPLRRERKVDWDGIWNTKTETAAWLASNCGTKNGRKVVAESLEEKGMQLDLWGDCGKPLPNCSRKDTFDCTEKYLSKYKFYLALENSNCQDYVTEKFWKSLTSYRAVPIVMKRSLYSSYQIPPSAFIAIDDFPSLENLTEYVQRVSANRTAYLEHHQWRKTHIVKSDYSSSLCELCRRLRNHTYPPKTYENLASWFSATTCDEELYKKYVPWSRRLYSFFDPIFDLVF